MVLVSEEQPMLAIFSVREVFNMNNEEAQTCKKM